MLEVCSLCCFSMFVFDVQLLVVLLLLLVEVVLFHLPAHLLLESKKLFLGVLVVILHLLSLFSCVLNIFVRRNMEVLLSELKDVEVVDLPSSMWNSMIDVAPELAM